MSEYEHLSDCHGFQERNQTEQLKRQQKALLLVSLVCFVFMIGEIVGGIYSNSLGILTDAAHLFSDLLGFIFTLAAQRYAFRRASSRATFGYWRAEILGGLTTVVLVWCITGILIYIAIHRLVFPSLVDGKLMFILAVIATCVNVINAFILYKAAAHDHTDTSPFASQNVNFVATLIHVVGDTAQSIAVMIASGLIWYNPSWHFLDGICTFTFAILILVTTRKVIKQCCSILMELVPTRCSRCFGSSSSRCCYCR